MTAGKPQGPSVDNSAEIELRARLQEEERRPLRKTEGDQTGWIIGAREVESLTIHADVDDARARVSASVPAARLAG